MKPFHQEDGITILQGDCREILPTLPDQSVNCCVTSPPYWGLRDYGVVGQLGLEPTPEEYVFSMLKVFREVRRVLRDDGTLWLNLGDSYAGGSERSCKQRTNRGGYGQIATPIPDNLKPKDLVGIPWRVAFALQADGWYLRSDIIWHKPNPMPESVTDRPTKAHEYLFLLSKSASYYYDAGAITEPGSEESVARRERADLRLKAGYSDAHFGNPPVKPTPRRAKLVGRERESHEGFNDRWNGAATRNKRSVWTVATQPFPEANFATFPEGLIKPCILAGCPAGGTVLDPFGGSGTTMQVARALGCRGLMIELNRDYCRLGATRLRQAVLPLAENPAECRKEAKQETKDLVVYYSFV